jgi:predicted TPR repeat methyltransferase
VSAERGLRGGDTATESAERAAATDASATDQFAWRFPIRGARVVSRVDEILRLCRGKKVLHLGCTDAPYTKERGERLLHTRMLEVTDASALWGLDVSEDGCRMLQEMGFDHVLHGNVEDMSASLLAENFDVVVAGEIIEHLANVGLFLDGVREIMSPTTELVVTTPNASSIKGFVHALLRREKVHPDHNYYFSHRTATQVLEKFGLTPREVYYYQDVEGTGMTRFVDRTFKLATKWSPVWADGVIARARRG